MRFPLPDAALGQHIAILGKTGSGKSTTAKGCVEHIVKTMPGARVCILDPIKSDWWGLTSSADGSHAGLPFHILGGPHGHVPLHASSGKAIGELVGTGALPLSIVDMADFPPGGLSQFFNDFAPALMRNARGVVYLILEEAHEFAPKERAGVGAETMSIYHAKKLATAGRSKGIRLVVLTQRTQALHNAVLGSCDTMVAHRLTAPADQDPVKAWLKAHVDKATFEKVAGSLASLPTGSAWVCSGEANLAERIEFPRITTFDNSATPTIGGAERKVTTAPVDQAKLRAIIGDAVAEAEANDPAALKARIKALEAEITKKPGPAIDEASIERARAAGFELGQAAAAARLKTITDDVHRARHALELATQALAAPLPTLRPEDVPSSHKAPPAPGIAHRQAPYVPAPPPPRQPGGPAAEGALKPALQRVVNAIGWWRQIGQDPVDRSRACVVAGLSPKASTFGVYIGELIKLGLVVSSPGKVGLTAEGVALAVVPAGDTRQQIHDVARGLLGQQERRVFDVIYAAHPAEIARAAVAEAVGLSTTASTIGVYIGAIAAFGIIENGSRGHVRAARWLFP